jgi:cytosine/adenosine deaminase-related metal-dependent hydrolase
MWINCHLEGIDCAAIERVGRVLVRAAHIVDGDGVNAAPGALLAEAGRIVASGPPASIGAVANDVPSIDLPGCVLMPGLVNAHAHLDLTHVGAVPYGGDFVAWIDMVRARRATEEAAIEASVRAGAMLARTGGTAFVGDIAGTSSPAAVKGLRASGLTGVSYLEVFGHGRRQAGAIARLEGLLETIPLEADGVRVGIQPHAPYSCGPEVYRAAAATDRPLATHLAETPAEIEFTSTGGGPLAGLLRRLGVWDPSIEGDGLHPVDALAAILASRPMVAAHLNYIDERHVEILARMALTVAYCPRASAYFRHPEDGRPAHRYRALLDAGVNVALGTDSAICLPASGRLSVLDEMRFLWRRDGTVPRRLLGMATVGGAHGLGIDPSLVTLAPGPTAGVIAVDTGGRDGDDHLRAALECDAPTTWVLHGDGSIPPVR